MKFHLEKHFYLWYTEIKHERIIKRHLRQSNWNKAICIFDEWKMETKELKLLYRKLESERRYTTKFRVFRHWRVRTIKWKARKYLLKLGAKHKRQQDIYRTLNVWNRFAKRNQYLRNKIWKPKSFCYDYIVDASSGVLKQLDDLSKTENIFPPWSHSNQILDIARYVLRLETVYKEEKSWVVVIHVKV